MQSMLFAIELMNETCFEKLIVVDEVLVMILTIFFLFSVFLLGLAVDTAPNSSSSPSMLPLYVPSSTVSVFSSSKDVSKSLENHHHHPISTSSLSHLTNLPQSDDPGHGASGEKHQTCYVCLPPDKTSRDAEDILSIFPQETGQHIPDCASFGSQNANKFEFKCPAEYVGCLLRIHGESSRLSFYIYCRICF